MTRRNATRKANLDAVGDAELVTLARQRDGGAFRAIMQRHNQRLYRLARGMMHNDSEAEDVVQEGYMRAFANLDGFRGESSLATWLSRIVLNEALGRLRRRRPTVELESIEERQPQGQVVPFPLASAQIDPERTVAQRQIQAILERAIDELPEAFRTVLIARVVEGMSVEETADLFDLRPATVKTRLHRARGLLRKALEKHVGSAFTDAFPFAGRRCERMTSAVLTRLGVSDLP